MNQRYEACRTFWNEVFQKEDGALPTERFTGNAAFDRALAWVCDGTARMLDFGCGSGTLLFYCALYGTKEHVGVDLSSAAIAQAKKRAEKAASGRFSFREGGVETLSSLPNRSVDGALLSNILDNLYPDDARLLLRELRRLLRPGGRLLVKLNPHLSAQEIAGWNMQVIEGNLLDDGLLLWNNTTEEWQALLSEFFAVRHYEEIFYPEHEQVNRLFLLEAAPD